MWIVDRIIFVSFKKSVVAACWVLALACSGFDFLWCGVCSWSLRYNGQKLSES